MTNDRSDLNRLRNEAQSMDWWLSFRIQLASVILGKRGNDFAKDMWVALGRYKERYGIK